MVKVPGSDLQARTCPPFCATRSTTGLLQAGIVTYLSPSEPEVTPLLPTSTPSTGRPSARAAVGRCAATSAATKTGARKRMRLIAVTSIAGSDLPTGVARTEVRRIERPRHRLRLSPHSRHSFVTH